MNNPFADVIYFNGYIYTADNQNRVVDAIALRDGYILATGTSDELHQYVGPETESIDLEGKMMMPGIIDTICTHFGVAFNCSAAI